MSPRWSLCPGCDQFPRRYVVCFLCFLAMMITYIMRFCLSIAITEMVLTHGRNSSSELLDGTCPYDDGDEVGVTVITEVSRVFYLQ